MDGIPNVLIEAMAAGRPVISTSVSGIPALIEHGTDGILVAPGNSRELFQAMADCLSDSELRKKSGARARMQVEQKFDIHDVATKLIGLFQ